MSENAIQSFSDSRYGSDQKAVGTLCNLISVTKSWNWKAKAGGTSEADCQTVQRKKTFRRDKAVQFNGSGNTELFSACYLYQY